MAIHEQDPDGYQLQVWAVPAPTGEGFAARLTVRRFPTLRVVFEDESSSEGTGWALPQQALAAALDRGRQFIRNNSTDRAVWACTAAPGAIQDSAMTLARRRQQ